MTQDELIDVVMALDDTASARAVEALLRAVSEDRSSTPPLEDQLRWIREMTL